MYAYNNLYKNADLCFFIKIDILLWLIEMKITMVTWMQLRIGLVGKNVV